MIQQKLWNMLNLSKRWKQPGSNVLQAELEERASGSLMPTVSTRMSTASQTSQWVVEKMCETLVFQGQCDRRVLWSSDRRRMPADLPVPRVKQDCMKRQNTLFVMYLIRARRHYVDYIFLPFGQNIFPQWPSWNDFHSDCVMFTWFDHLEETFPSSCFLYNRYFLQDQKNQMQGQRWSQVPYSWRVSAFSHGSSVLHLQVPIIMWQKGKVPIMTSCQREGGEDFQISAAASLAKVWDTTSLASRWRFSDKQSNWITLLLHLNLNIVVLRNYMSSPVGVSNCATFSFPTLQEFWAF